MTFAPELRRAMKARGFTQTALGRQTGYGSSNLSPAIAGRRLPSPEVVVRLAEALDWPALVERAIEERTSRCVLCGATFVRPAPGKRRVYCGRNCRRAAQARQSRDWRRTRTLTETRLTKDRLALHQEAVAAFCRQCEPEGQCRDAGCLLRPVSPLPMAVSRRVAA